MTLALPRRSSKRKKITVGPQDDGRRMPLADFDRAIGVEGYLYELNQGVIEVSDIPSLGHATVIDVTREELSAYRRANPEMIHFVGGGAESKVVIHSLDSERHPDLAVYLRESPPVQQPWALWVPEIVIEVVSDSSRKRDYDQKPPQYLALGVLENWILDPIRQTALQKVRVGGLWKDAPLKASQKLKTNLLPGFALDLKRIFAAAARTGKAK